MGKKCGDGHVPSRDFKPQGLHMHDAYHKVLYASWDYSYHFLFFLFSSLLTPHSSSLADRRQLAYEIIKIKI